jgi:hypothetical protein
MGGMKFSIRDVLLGTLIAGLALGWWLDRSQLSQQLLVPSQPPAAADERYELIVPADRSDALLLFDPKTGKMWQRSGNGNWFPHADPVKDPKR